jgi:hypothetical protein
MSATTIPLRNVRYAGAAMLGAALVWPALPVHPPYPCPLRSTTGLPCPFCGMTRAVVAAVHGDIGASLRYNPGGVVIVVLAVVALLTWRTRTSAVRVPRWLPGALLALLAPLWVYNVTLNPTF